MGMNDLSQMLPILIPLAVLEFILAAVALINIIKHKKFKVLPKPLWIVIVIVIGVIGPILYFLIGRSEE